MAEAPVTAATGALGPVIAKLAALLGSEYKLRRRTRRDVKFIRSKLKPVHSILWNIWEREELDEASKALKMEALDLADELDDAIFDFILTMERSLTNKQRLVQTKIKESPFEGFKKRAADVSVRCRSRWKKPFSCLLSCGKIALAGSIPSKPRAYPFVRKDVSELVGMMEPRDALIRHLVGEEETTPVELQLKTASIYGIAGMGKTTLADLVYEAIGHKFQSRAFVSITPGGNMREVLTRILQQVAPVLPAGTEASTEEQLIDIVPNFLNDKRYLVIIDDIWNWTEWEVITKSLPENNLGSRIVRTSRRTDVANNWGSDAHDPDNLLHKMIPMWDFKTKSFMYKIGEENIATRMLAMKPDLVSEGFDHEHRIVQMCGGTPLAVRCMLSAVADKREKQEQQGLHVKICDVQDEIEKQVIANGIQNTPGFEALVESLQLDFDNLPHHMLKTSLLYFIVNPEDYYFEQHMFVRWWICEGFVHTEEEANGYFQELFDRGFILLSYSVLRMHPMMRSFLRCKSRQDNFVTLSSEITPSDDNRCRIRRLCICGSEDAVVDPLSVLDDWKHIRSLIVYYGGIKRVPFEKLQGVRLLDLCESTDLEGRHWKIIWGLVRLRHLLGFNGDGKSETLPEIVKLQCLETFQANGGEFTRLPSFIGNLQQLKTLEVKGDGIEELPREIGSLQQLETLNIRYTKIRELPIEIWSLQQLKTLDITSTPIRQLPQEIGKLQNLQHLLMIGTEVEKVPKEVGLLKKLKSLKLEGSCISHLAVPFEVCQVSGALLDMPGCIGQALKKSDLLSKLAKEMISFQKYIGFSRVVGSFVGGGLVVGAKQMQIPQWIGDHFNDLARLDIRICKLEEEGLKILGDMPKLRELTLRFLVVPSKPVVISSRHGFTALEEFIIDSRVPRVTFKERAMPHLRSLSFYFQLYAGPPSKEPLGTNHLGRLQSINFHCNFTEDWYPAADSPCIRHLINVVKEESQYRWKSLHLYVCGDEVHLLY